METPEPEHNPAPAPSEGPPQAPAQGGEEPFADCGAIEVSCHVSNWFHDLVKDALNPLFGWIGQIAFHTPVPTSGVEGLWSGVLAVSNALYVLLVVAGGLVVMSHESVQTRYGAGEVLPRLAFAFVASNCSLWLATQMITGANAVSAAVASMSVDAEEAARNLRERMEYVLMEAIVFVLLLLVVVVVLVVVWCVMDLVRIVMSITLVIAAPLLLMFHALPQTNRLAELWWRAMAGLLAVPIAQAVAFGAFMRLFFQGELSYFGNIETSATGGLAPGPGTVMVASKLVTAATDPGGTQGLVGNVLLFLVLLYIQIRVPFWVFKLVWSPHPGRSPLVMLGKSLAMILLYRTVKGVKLGQGASAPAGGGAAMMRPVGAARYARAGGGPGQRGPRPQGAAAGAGRGVQPVQPSIWWYRPRYEPPTPAGDLGGGRRRRELPAAQEPGASPPQLPGPPSPPAPPSPRGPRPGSPSFPGSQPGETPAWGPRWRPVVPPARPRPASPSQAPQQPVRPRQLELFELPQPAARPSSPSSPSRPGQQSGPASGEAGRAPKRRWRQGVLPTPPPQRIPGRRATLRLGEVWDAPPSPPARKPRQAKGQVALSANPKPRWVQRRLPFPRS
ncbi:type IV secretion system protein [Salinactinospora qingdaonensis]|uniref:type IV secretion system protein n=1 Tax=Salinactinospora qingdaonensis TaxID=702744 RepID=UPI0031E5EB0C